MESPIVESKDVFLLEFPDTTCLPSEIIQTEAGPPSVKCYTRDSNDDVVVQSLSCVQLFDPLELHHTSLLCPSLSPRVCSNSCPWWLSR